ncbi:type A2 lantipeptide [Streptomyces sp. RKAG337]|uniref:type A2 lantipeptide n=1 Tax=Streptomyces sp. RKAG337 TaxID=2893404 RepID=UPI00203428F4|nr:type A2 lantipeptide [Streptomyces sp. RKAG337]MCM2430026.1 type A2 lantipeptide [Streptomyces sp. RKAG337]
MRNDFTPQVETREISDSDLDNVSGGVGVGVGVDGLSVGDIVGTVESALPVSLPLSTVTGLLPAQVNGLAAGL